jgi:hypothetical protein
MKAPVVVGIRSIISLWKPEFHFMGLATRVVLLVGFFAWLEVIACFTFDDWASGNSCISAANNLSQQLVG